MIRGVNHLTFAVRDLDESLAFYAETLGLSLVARWDGGAYLLAGEDWVTLIVDEAASDSPRPDYTHTAFTVAPQDFEAAKSRALGAGARVWQENQSEGDSLYILDPDGHKLELHASDLGTRLAADRENPPPGMTFYR